MTCRGLSKSLLNLPDESKPPPDLEASETSSLAHSGISESCLERPRWKPRFEAENPPPRRLPYPVSSPVVSRCQRELDPLWYSRSPGTVRQPPGFPAVPPPKKNKYIF